MRLRTLDANWNRIRMHRGSCRHEYRNFPNTIGIQMKNDGLFLDQRPTEERIPIRR